LKAGVKEALLKNYLTPDLGGTKKTTEVGDWLGGFVLNATAS
jgi:hypothetical protein